MSLHLYIPKEDPKVAMPSIERLVSDEFGITRDQLRGHGQSRRFSVPRQVAMWLARDLNRSSLPEIGYWFDRDHTTVLHALKQINRKRVQLEFSDRVDRLRLALAETVR